MASSTRAWCLLRRTKERTTIAPDTPRRRTSVARKVYKYNELELCKLGPLEFNGVLELCVGRAGMSVDWDRVGEGVVREVGLDVDVEDKPPLVPDDWVV